MHLGLRGLQGADRTRPNRHTLPQCDATNQLIEFQTAGKSLALTIGNVEKIS